MKYFSLDDLIESNLKSIAEPSNNAAPEVVSETDSLKELSEAMNQASSEDEEAAIREALKSLNKGEFDGLLDDINDEDIAELMNQAQWILRVLRAYGIDPAVLDSRSVDARMRNRPVRGRRISDPIPIHSGLFQGDSLSPLLFITALNPISWRVSQSDHGLQLPSGRRLNHLLFVDDWKLFAATTRRGVFSTRPVPPTPKLD